MVTHLLLILDKSSSMNSIRQETVDHYNEVLDANREAANDEHKILVSLVEFNQEVFEVFWEQNITQCARLTLADFQPSGMTALWDGMGQGIARLAQNADKTHAYCCVTLSDGGENSSKPGAKSECDSLVKSLKRKGNWTFQYIGCDPQNLRETRDMGMASMSWTASSEGAKHLTGQVTDAFRRYNYSRAAGVMSVNCLVGDDTNPS
jgi:Mg-chelatase subunit ChlD